MTLVVVVVGGPHGPLINWIIVASQCVKGLFKAYKSDLLHLVVQQWKP